VNRGAIGRTLCSGGFLWSLVGLGILLRVWAYGSNTSLWLDEILLSRNILDLPVGSLLTRPLELDQVAPRGFLLGEWLAVRLMGRNELALRLLPFLCSVAGMMLFRSLVVRALDGLAVPLALGLFAIAVPLIRYGAEVKQYELDAAAAIALLLLALGLRDSEASTRRLIAAGAAGLVIVWFSQASVLVMGGLGLAMAVQWLIARDRGTMRALAITVAMWAIASIVAIADGRRSMTPATQSFMDEFWRTGFFPWPMTSFSDLGWFWTQASTLLTDPFLLRYRWPALFLGLALVGLVALWRRRRDVALSIGGPVVVAIVAAVAHQYPFRGRLMVYLIPSFLLAIAAGAELVREAASRVHFALGAAVMLVPLVPAVEALAAAPPPYDGEHHRAVLQFLEQHRRPDDVIHVFPLSRIGMLFYGPRYGIEPGDWITAKCDRRDTRTYVRDVDRYRGRSRVWVLSAGARPYRMARSAVREYLGTIGVRRDSLVLPSLALGSVTLDLYDLSDPIRLQTASAESFPVPVMATDPAPGCRPWTQPPA
jgi:hypothetical protein